MRLLFFSATIFLLLTTQASGMYGAQSSCGSGQGQTPCGPGGPEQGGPRMGTWKLNAAKSKLTSGAPKNTTVVYEAAGDKVKVTVEGVDSEGKPTHNEWIGKFDGRDYSVTGDPSSDVRSYKVVDDRTLTFTARKNGKVTTTGRIIVSADGKSRTVTADGTDTKGNKFSSIAQYDKQ